MNESCICSRFLPLEGIRGLFVIIGLLATSLCSGSFSHAQDQASTVLQLKFNTDGGVQDSVGEVVAEYEGGSLLFQTPDGQLWTILGTDVISREEVKGPMVPLTSKEIYQQYKEELPPGFLIHTTKHYVILYNTSEPYAKWAGELYERVYRTFYTYWKNEDFRYAIKLEEPRFPLVAILFKDRNSYLAYAKREVGDSAEAMIGYYNQNNNRMISYDLTGTNGGNKNVRALLAKPEWERTVATVVHEAVHQISYNSGLQVRLADNPRWLSEGMAMFFESPNPKSRGGWSMGNVNYHNLNLFNQYYSRFRPADSLATLIASDKRMLETQQAVYAYPESWALTNFLIRKHGRQYGAYLNALADSVPLGETTERERVELFKKHFGDDLMELEKEFIRYMRIVNMQK